MAAIQDGQQHVEIEDRPKLSGVQFLLQAFMLTLWVMAAMFCKFW